jgi:hypothetical protein
MLPLSKKIRVMCPLCEKNLSIFVDEEMITQSKKFPIALSLEHCNRIHIIYIDAQFKVRAIDSTFKVQGNRISSSDDSYIIEKIDQDFFENRSIEERTLYRFESNYNNVAHQDIPDLFEKQLLRIIYKYKEISLHDILAETLILAKALDRKINSNVVQNTLEKYIEQKVISKRILSYKGAI